MDNSLLNPEKKTGLVYVAYMGQAIKKVYFFTEKYRNKEKMSVLHQFLACSWYQIFMVRVVVSDSKPIRCDENH